MAKQTLDTSEMADSSSSEEFETMYESNAPAIYRFMFWRTKDQMLAEDLTSNVFEKAWRSRRSFRGGSAKAWLHRIAHNTLIDYWRKRQELLLEDRDVPQIESAAKGAGEVLDQRMLVADLRHAVHKLPKDMRQVVELRFIEGLSSRQTGQKMGISEANVRVMQYRALRKLRGYLR